MTIHWKAFEEHFLMVPLLFRFIHFWVGDAFYEFFSKKSLVSWKKKLHQEYHEAVHAK
jgi:23S rRNA maturation mini-RNase III